MQILNVIWPMPYQCSGCAALVKIIILMTYAFSHSFLSTWYCKTCTWYIK